MRLVKHGYFGIDASAPGWAGALLDALEQACPAVAAIRARYEREWSDHPGERHPAAALDIDRRHWLLDEPLVPLQRRLIGMGFAVDGPPPRMPGMDDDEKWLEDPVRLGWKPRRHALPRRGPDDYASVEVDAFRERDEVALIIEWDASGRSFSSESSWWLLNLDASHLVLATWRYEARYEFLKRAWGDADLVEKMRVRLPLRGVLLAGL